MIDLFNLLAESRWLICVFVGALMVLVATVPDAWRWRLCYCVLIVGGALSLRYVPEMPDTASYRKAAIDGGFIHRTPGLPLLLAALPEFIVKLFNVAAVILSGWIVCRWGALAAAVFCADIALWVFSGTLLTEPMSVLLVTMAVEFTMKHRAYRMSAVCWALAALFRPSNLLLAAPWGLWLLWKDWRRSVMPGIIILSVPIALALGNWGRHGVFVVSDIGAYASYEYKAVRVLELSTGRPYEELRAELMAPIRALPRGERIAPMQREARRIMLDHIGETTQMVAEGFFSWALFSPRNPSVGIVHSIALWILVLRNVRRVPAWMPAAVLLLGLACAGPFGNSRLRLPALPILAFIASSNRRTTHAEK